MGRSTGPADMRRSFSAAAAAQLGRYGAASTAAVCERKREMTFIETYGKEIVAIAVPLLTWALNTFFKAKAKLLLASPHTFTFLVQQPLVDDGGKQISPTQAVKTRSLMVRNAGRETATKLEWVFNWKPLCINIWPSRHFDEHVQPDGRYVMIFPSLAPGEYLGCELFSINGDLPNLVTVRSDQCVAQTIAMYPQPVRPTWQRRLAILFWLAGLGVAVYAMLLLLQFLILKTPLGH
jgi:hypothetical protein